MQMIGHFKMLFSLLASPHHSVQVSCKRIKVDHHMHPSQDSALAVISGTTGNAECVADIAGSLCLGR